MKFFKTRKKTVRDEQTTELTVVADTWKVSWYSRYGEFSGEVDKEAEFFLDKDEAIMFKKSLEDAFKLIKHTSGNIVTLEKYNN